MMTKLRMAIFSCFFGALFGISAMNSAAPDRDYLESRDVPLIMRDILRQHVKHKKMDPDLIARAAKMYIDQADPERVYFLEEEVNPFTNMNPQVAYQILQEFIAGRYDTFFNINRQYQNAILRSREIRQDLEENIPFLIELSKEPGALVKGLPKDRSEKPEFVETVAELKERTKDDLIRFIAAQRLRVGEDSLVKHKDRIIPLYESRRRSHEKEYLLQTSDGEPFDDLEKEHYMILHVLKAAVAGLDAHTAFFDSAEAYDMRVRLEKGFQGIGVVLQESLEGVVILRLIDGGPAALSGQIEPNDRLVEIDGRSIVDVPFRDILDLIRGKDGSIVNLGIKRLQTNDFGVEEDTFHSVDLQRGRVIVNEDRTDVEVFPHEDGIIGVIRLHSFYEGKDGLSSEGDVKKALADLNKQGNLQGLVLDLRQNTGGFLVQAVKVAGLFISSGVVVVSKYGNGHQKVFRDIDGHTYYNGPLVVLTSKASASAAEIVAQALQDWGKAVVVGDEQTYGKGSIQHQTITNESSTSFFKVTVGRFYTVSGRSTQIRGVEADIIVPSPLYKEPIGEEHLDYPLPNDQIAALYDDELNDVEEAIRYWYRRYYTPSVQTKVRYWSRYLPELESRSQKRVQQSQKFQEFLTQTDADRQAEAIKIAEKRAKKEKLDDIQLQEAVNVVGDMINISTEQEEFPESSFSRLGKGAKTLGSP